jgi:hypothetical protein
VEVLDPQHTFAAITTHEIILVLSLSVSLRLRLSGRRLLEGSNPELQFSNTNLQCLDLHFHAKNCRVKRTRSNGRRWKRISRRSNWVEASGGKGWRTRRTAIGRRSDGVEHLVITETSNCGGRAESDGRGC